MELGDNRFPFIDLSRFDAAAFTAKAPKSALFTRRCAASPSRGRPPARTFMLEVEVDRPVGLARHQQARRERLFDGISARSSLREGRWIPARRPGERSADSMAAM
jgi:hypothetical protein